MFTSNLGGKRDDVSTYDNKALDEKELHDVRMKLLEAEDILERDFRTIEEEVKAHPLINL